MRNRTKCYYFGMRRDLKVQKVRTGSGATAAQIIQYSDNKRIIVKHLGSAHTEEELKALCNKAEAVREQLCLQLSIFFSVALDMGSSSRLHAFKCRDSSKNYSFSIYLTLGPLPKRSIFPALTS